MNTKSLDLTSQSHELSALIAVQPGAVVSRALVNKPAGTLTLFAFDAGEGLSEHAAPYDALVHVIEGEAQIHIASQAHIVRAGHIILLPANVPHTVRADVPFKMLLTMIRV